MTENAQFPDNFELYCKQHPEKFEDRQNNRKRVLFAIGVVVCALIVFFPSILSRIPIIALFPMWLPYIAAILCGLYCLLAFFFDSDTLYNRSSNGKIKHIGHKKFDRVSVKAEQVIAALEKHDFDFLADAPQSENDPVQLYVYEDAVGKEFYLHLRVYTAPSEFGGVMDVVTVSDREYDLFKTAIRSIGPVKN